MISIITATIRLDGLKNVIENLKNQTIQDFEHIIVNDGQQDIKDYLEENNIPFVNLPVDLKGFGGFARNIGIMASKRKWITFFDDDNKWYPNHLETLVSGIESGCPLIAVDCEVRGKKNRKYRHIRKCAIAPQNIDLGQILYRRDLFWKYGFFYPRKERMITFDWELINKMCQHERIYIIHKSTFVFYHRRR